MRICWVICGIPIDEDVPIRRLLRHNGFSLSSFQSKLCFDLQSVFGVWGDLKPTPRPAEREGLGIRIAWLLDLAAGVGDVSLLLDLDFVGCFEIVVLAAASSVLSAELRTAVYVEGNSYPGSSSG
ncbi:hypothetical protein VE00_08689 [Pseudogymnoascus sp. WSF 3629]|nr:hypothetical protein VE00_08689 [Pseudogymnoascus sp. WSF 3629]